VRMVASTFLLLFMAACSRGMYDNARLKALEEFSYNQPIGTPEGTVARGHLKIDAEFYRGTKKGKFVHDFPVGIDLQTLQRGRERYDIFCAACHDRLGYGQGIIVRRGFKRPESFHAQRLREAPVGYYFAAITRGYRTMFPMASQISARDRWAIVAYVRALQKSQHAKLSEIPDSAKKTLIKEGQ
jgi:mono/diheme cytochrome c family protein